MHTLQLPLAPQLQLQFFYCLHHLEFNCFHGSGISWHFSCLHWLFALTTFSVYRKTRLSAIIIQLQQALWSLTLTVLTTYISNTFSASNTTVSAQTLSGTAYTILHGNIWTCLQSMWAHIFYWKCHLFQSEYNALSDTDQWIQSISQTLPNNRLLSYLKLIPHVSWITSVLSLITESLSALFSLLQSWNLLSWRSWETDTGSLSYTHTAHIHQLKHMHHTGT